MELPHSGTMSPQDSTRLVPSLFAVVPSTSMWTALFSMLCLRQYFPLTLIQKYVQSFIPLETSSVSLRCLGLHFEKISLLSFYWNLGVGGEIHLLSSKSPTKVIKNVH